jgi:hypothetical protein
MDMGCNRRLSKPPSVEEKYCLHLLATNIEDKQFLWHLILMLGNMRSNSSMKPEVTSTISSFNPSQNL